ncbi:hypothetical protein TWF225_009376 [Orbilia oligospora]|nr:hypothetical protein TWF225_009376 [Orbilia oligospora]KAF3270019.1 hypothetical protein TWF217_008362 [Orbilia oligospora]KAF3270484.1 hypothetical protein TWF128_004251 [Orbilia oligospora]KAF3298031.1 hypothetical protein TWF132_004173 [Orbilia oligospora]
MEIGLSDGEFESHLSRMSTFSSQEKQSEQRSDLVIVRRGFHEKCIFIDQSSYRARECATHDRSQRDLGIGDARYANLILPSIRSPDLKFLYFLLSSTESHTLLSFRESGIF